MDNNISRLFGTGLLFLITFLTGFWLSNSGRPYNGIVLTAHKLISLAAAVLIAVIVYQANRGAALGATEIAAVAVTGLFFVGTIVTGGLLSTDKAMPTLVTFVHLIGPFLTVLSSAVTLYLVHGR
jgi:hypothetical protein